MSRYFVRHQHPAEHCPAKDPQIEFFPASPCKSVVERQGC
jgi:hypothetical protein